MAFPTTGVLDDFNRANGPAGSAWTSPVAFEAAIFEVVSNKASDFGDGGGYWDASTFGPDSEVYVDVATVNLMAKSLVLRVGSPGSSYNGYRTRFVNTTSLTVNRVDAGTSTQLGASISYTIASGDSVGFEVIGSDLAVYKKTGGSWSSIDTRSDSTHTSAGYIGWFGADGDDLLDNFGGGTVDGGVTASARNLYVSRSNYVLA